MNIYNFQDLAPNELIFPLMKELYEEHGGLTEYVYKRYNGRLGDFNDAITKMLNSIGLDRATSNIFRTLLQIKNKVVAYRSLV